MSNEIENWARSHFKKSSSVNFSFKNLEYYELGIFVDELSLEESGWNNEELRVEGVKSYDKDGNSFYIGVLVLDAREKTANDFLKLAPYFDEFYL